MENTTLKQEDGNPITSFYNVQHCINTHGMLQGVIHVMYNDCYMEEVSEKKNTKKYTRRIKENTLFFFHDGFVHNAEGFELRHEQEESRAFGLLCMAIGMIPFVSNTTSDNISEWIGFIDTYAKEIEKDNNISYYFMIVPECPIEELNEASPASEALMNFVSVISSIKETRDVKIINLGQSVFPIELNQVAS